jgi:SAM-dependent methyltransferase
VTLLAEDPDLWDRVFHESPARARFVEILATQAGANVLDVGCATGSLCGRLRRRGVDAVGVDINPRFVAAARAKDPGGEYHVGDMKRFRLRQRFDLMICLGSTFSYNLTNEEVAETLINFRKHLRPGGQLVIDVLNAIAFTGPRPFQIRTQHKFSRKGVQATATIRHRMNLKMQTMQEQVTWSTIGERGRRDPEEALRLFFPQELAFHLDVAGFGGVRLMDSFGRTSSDFSGRRLIAVATHSLA